ncbi:hypothetical protein BCON_0093g00220 [Botryotinia convoluta]|uniref:Uncharacterized protein n=1 Tax=Botryotinia convoluta TaxID=54673 RepID=A0A4Z1I175_9HELO|nr:hypothetical protein BCON_0093g00220 [Botryotinia convoluta]
MHFNRNSCYAMPSELYRTNVEECLIMTRHGITKVAAAKLILPTQNIDGADVTERRKKKY